MYIDISVLWWVVRVDIKGGTYYPWQDLVIDYTYPIMAMFPVSAN